MTVTSNVRHCTERNTAWVDTEVVGGGMIDGVWGWNLSVGSRGTAHGGGPPKAERSYCDSQLLSFACNIARKCSHADKSVGLLHLQTPVGDASPHIPPWIRPEIQRWENGACGLQKTGSGGACRTLSRTSSYEISASSYCAVVDTYRVLVVTSLI